MEGLTGKDVTYIVTAAVYAELSSHCYGATEEEKSVEDVESEWDNGASQNSSNGTGYEEKEREHGEDCDKHVVVNDGRIASVGIGDDVTDQRHDEKSPEKL